jgi:hypothetical protein
MLLEFFEDLYETQGDSALDDLWEDGETDPDVCFETGDPEFDALEKRITDGTISDEEISRVLDSWQGKKPAAKLDEPPAAPLEDLGDGFADAYGAS